MKDINTTNFKTLLNQQEQLSIAAGLNRTYLNPYVITPTINHYIDTPLTFNQVVCPDDHINGEVAFPASFDLRTP